MSQPSHATPRKSLPDVCLAPAKAHLVITDPVYACIEAVAATFQESDKEMAARLGIAQSNYSRRTYNAARVQRLPEEMRHLFLEYFAKTQGLTVERATPHDQVKAAAKLAIVNLLELMERA